MVSGREVGWPPARHVVAHDSDGLHAVMQPVEARALERVETRGDDAAQFSDRSIEPLMKPHVQTVGQQMPPTKLLSVGDELVERKANRRIVGGDNGAGARSDDDVDRDAVLDELLKDSNMAGASQASTAQHHGDARYSCRLRLSTDQIPNPQSLVFHRRIHCTPATIVPAFTPRFSPAVPAFEM